MGLWVALGVLAVAVLYVIAVYNGLIVARNRTDEALSDIDTLLKRRYDLIPNLVETVKGYAKHESETLENVIRARNSAISAQQGEGLAGRFSAENELSGALKTIFALSEAYPDLKANQNFMSLQGELATTEDKLQASRRFYNSMVLSYNNKILMFPGSIIAGMFSFTKRDFFELDEAEAAAARKAPQVKF
ncbi:MAG: LemA family protein [Synergistaceae bacterium]|jgi:LemA protein|nr:LemA family protein [Synergistaceae bacterium]